MTVNEIIQAYVFDSELDGTIKVEIQDRKNSFKYLHNQVYTKKKAALQSGYGNSTGAAFFFANNSLVVISYDPVRG